MPMPVIATIFGHSKEKTTEIYATKHQGNDFFIRKFNILGFQYPIK